MNTNSAPPGHPVIRTVLFDLDGTLLDTAPDLAFALNQVREEQGLPSLAFDQVRAVVSHGGRALIELGFGSSRPEPELERLRQRLMAIYGDNLARSTNLFPGMDQVLDGIEQRRMNWGVVTNKPAFLTEPLLQRMNLHARAACVVSGDTLAERKPHAAPMLHACDLAGSRAAECVYVGDARRDVEAGRRAGMHTLVVLFGYFREGDRPSSWGADGLANNPLEILDWIEQHNAAPA